MTRSELRLLADVVNRMLYIQSLIEAPLVSDFEQELIARILRHEEQLLKAAESAAAASANPDPTSPAPAPAGETEGDESVPAPPTSQPQSKGEGNGRDLEEDTAGR